MRQAGRDPSRLRQDNRNTPTQPGMFGLVVTTRRMGQAGQAGGKKKDKLIVALVGSSRAPAVAGDRRC